MVLTPQKRSENQEMNNAQRSANFHWPSIDQLKKMLYKLRFY